MARCTGFGDLAGSTNATGFKHQLYQSFHVLVTVQPSNLPSDGIFELRLFLIFVWHVPVISILVEDGHGIGTIPKDCASNATGNHGEHERNGGHEDVEASLS